MPAEDLYRNENAGYGAPALDGEAVAPNDNVDLNYVSRALWIGGAGNIVVVMAGDKANDGAGTTLTFTGIPAGTLLPLAVARVKSTGTTATGIVALR